MRGSPRSFSFDDLLLELGFKEQTSIPHTLSAYRVMEVFHAKAEKVENAEWGRGQ